MVVPDTPMIMGGSSDPCGSAFLSSIGALGVQENKNISAVLFPMIQEAVGIQPDRCYINFYDKARADVGYNGGTFHKD